MSIQIPSKTFTSKKQAPKRAFPRARCFLEVVGPSEVLSITHFLDIIWTKSNCHRISATSSTMTTGFAGAASRLVSQASQAFDDEDDETVTLLSTSSEENRDGGFESEDEENLVVPKKRVYAKYRKLVWTPWTFGSDEYFYDEAQYTDALWELAKQEFGGLKENGVFFIKGTRRPPTKDKVVRIYRCAFHHCCSCGYQCQLVYWKAENRWSILVTSNIEHDHVLKKNPRGALKHCITAAINSPTKLNQRPKSLVGQVMLRLDETYTQRQQRSVSCRLNRLRVQNSKRVLTNGGDGSLYGDVVDQLLNKYRRDNIRSFNRDSVFLVGGQVVVRNVVDEADGSEQVRFYCVLSTENLLLNGPRQLQTGQQMMLAVDALYRYVVEKDHGLFVVKCINHCQSAKTIAYAICNREDKEALVWILQAIKDEIETIVNRLVQQGSPYM